MFGKLIPDKARSGEFFGFFDIFGKFSSIMGPALVGFVSAFTANKMLRFWMEDNTMDFQNTNLQGGSLQISTEVIGKIARCAALEIDGVAEVSCGKQNKKLKDLLEASSIQSPVTVEMRDGTANITLNLMVSFGARIPAVAEKVQENVKTAVQNMTNVTVSRVNLVIAGLADAAAAQE